MKSKINILKEDSSFVKACKNKERLLEQEGKFNEDANENTSNNAELVSSDFPYIKKGLINNIKHLFCTMLVKYYSNQINKKFTNLKVEKNKNLKNIKGAIITCNHISVVDSFAVRKAVGHNLFFVGAEYNNFKGFMGTLARNSGYIPLPSTLDTNKFRKFNNAISYYLKKGRKILVYPEQSMWRDYQKPRPLKNGAFRYAVMNNVPVIPLFITIKEKETKIDENGFQNFGDYTIHVLDPIYPKPEFNTKENIDYMRNKNYNVWKNIYEKTYEIPLEYSTINKFKIEI